ncbi:MAG: hypothetical protein QGF46_08215, partial [Planctomycetota bacterium]|nr:hypothetical protein [Planctomycetota bacterium]
RTKRMLIFDTGQSNENATWSEKLDFMKPSPKKWIQGYLNDLGFSKQQANSSAQQAIEKLGSDCEFQDLLRCALQS